MIFDLSDGGLSDEGRSAERARVDFLIDDDRCLRAEIRADDRRANLTPFAREHRECYHQPGSLIRTMNKLEMYVNAVHGGAIIKKGMGIA